MNNVLELLNKIQLRKKGLSLVMEEKGITSNDLMNTFYKLSDEVKDCGVEPFRLEAYNVVFGKYITSVQYTKDDKQYYMMMGADSYWTIPRQITVGTVINDKVYMMCEDLVNANSIELIAFPKFAINQRMNSFVLGSYRDTIRLFSNRYGIGMLSSESEKCLECGFESMDVFCSLINEVKEQDKGKRKKLSI